MKKINRLKINTDFIFYIYLLKGFFVNKRKTFLTKLQKYFNTRKIILFSQGRIAFYTCLNLLKKKNLKKNEVIICPYTLPEIIRVIKFLSLKPIFVDINVQTGMPIISHLEKKINKNTLCVVITHLYTSQTEILKIVNFIKKKNIVLIEDCAINFGSEVTIKNKIKKLGMLGDFGFYSFGIMKNLCLLNGGALICKDLNSYIQISKMTNKIKYPKIIFIKLILFSIILNILYSRIIYQIFTFYFIKYCYLRKNIFFKKMYPGLFPDISSKLPNNYNFDFFDPVASSALYQLSRIDTQKFQRIKKIKIYEKYLKSNKNIYFFKFNTYHENSFLELPILLKRKNNIFIKNKLLKKGIEIRFKWYKNNLEYKRFNYNSTKLEGCNYLSKQIICLPLHNLISEKDIKIICTELIKSL